VIGYDDSAEGRSRLAEDHVAPSLAIQLVTDRAECLHDLATGYDG